MVQCNNVTNVICEKTFEIRFKYYYFITTKWTDNIRIEQRFIHKNNNKKRALCSDTL